MKITARKMYIAMLRHRALGIDSLPFDEKEHFLWAELIAAGYLNGATFTNEKGSPNKNVIMGPTVKGRLFLQELEEAEANNTLKGRLVRYGIPAITYFGGLLSALLIEFLKKKSGL